jgi:hypothetical protein
MASHENVDVDWPLGTAAAAAIRGPDQRSGPPFRIDDPEPVKYKHWEVYGFSRATHIDRHTSGALPGLEVNYGDAPNLQLHLCKLDHVGSVQRLNPSYSPI